MVNSKNGDKKEDDEWIMNRVNRKGGLSLQIKLVEPGRNCETLT